MNTSSPSSSPTRSRTPSPKKARNGDRFIANRSLLDMDLSHFNLSNTSMSHEVCFSKKRDWQAFFQSLLQQDTSPSKEQYKQQLAQSLGKDVGSNILSFKEKAPLPPRGGEGANRVLYSQKSSFAAKPKVSRKTLHSRLFEFSHG
jgi:hypothetical protein